MPQNKFALARYRIIDQLLRKKKHVKTKEIAEQCRLQIGYAVSQRMIQRDMEAMQYDPILGYNAPIAYCPHLKAYSYESSDYAFVSFSFSRDEVQAIERIFEICRDNLSADDCRIVEQLLLKIKLHGDF